MGTPKVNDSLYGVSSVAFVEGDLVPSCFMASPETPHPEKPITKVELLIELAILDELIQPYLEAALAIDEIQHLDDLRNQRDWILDDIEALNTSQ